jgi:hypothetical protein
VPYNYNPGPITASGDFSGPMNGPSHNNFFREGGASPLDIPDRQKPGLGMPRTPTPMWVEPWTDPDVRRMGSPAYRGATPEETCGVRVLGSPPPPKAAGTVKRKLLIAGLIRIDRTQLSVI